MGFGLAGGAAGGGGGGTRVAAGVAAAAAAGCGLVWLGMTAAAGCGTGLGTGTGAGAAAEAAAPPMPGGGGTDRVELAPGLGCAGRLAVIRDGRPPGPPGLISFPLVIGRGGTGFARGVGRDTEFGGSPCVVWTAPLL